MSVEWLGQHSTRLPFVCWFFVVVDDDNACLSLAQFHSLRHAHVFSKLIKKSENYWRTIKNLIVCPVFFLNEHYSLCSNFVFSQINIRFIRILYFD